MAELDDIRDAIAGFLKTVNSTTIALTNTPREIVHGTRSDGVLDFFSVEPGDMRGYNILDIEHVGMGGLVENGAFMRKYLFTVWLFKDQRSFTRGDILTQLEAYANALLTKETFLNGSSVLVAEQRWYDPEIKYVSMGPDQESNYRFYFGVLTVGYINSVGVVES